MKKLLQRSLFYALLCIAPFGIKAQVKLAEWNFNTVYTQSTSADSTIFTPSSTLLTGDPGITMYNSKFKIYPDSAVGAIQKYAYNAVTTYCQLRSGFNNYISPVMFQGPSVVSDYSVSANHKNYFQFSLPTTGYDSIKVNFSIASGQNSTADYVELVYSTDGGTTWADAGSYHTLSGWWLYQNYEVAVSARNKQNVLFRLISNTTSTSGSANFALDYFIVKGKVYSAGTPVNTTSTVTWPFNLGTAGQLATYSAGTDGYFASNWVDNGSNLAYKTKITTYGITYSPFMPVVQNNTATANDYVGFNIRPKSGLSFKPTKITFDCVRYGTNLGSINVVWKSADGTLTPIATALAPARDNSGATTHAVYDLSGVTIPATTGDCTLYIYIYSLANTKQIGLSNIAVDGTVQGTITNVATHTFTTTVYPTGAGSIAANPVGNEFDEGTQITLTANRNFGYTFKEWRDAGTDAVVSTSNPYTVTLTANMALKAVYNPINTYSLTMNTPAGIPTYMVSVSPAGTVVNGQTMYEEGTSVTLTASSNSILTFTNWLSGETNPALSVPMTQNQNITAVYSAVDYIVGWDFYKAGYSSRPADFYSTVDNQTSALVNRKADGTVNGWLDKSILASGGYYGRGAAVCWKPMADQYYYQTSFSTKDFTDVKVSAGMLFNYNAYSVQKCEYSLDGTNFTTLGSYTLIGGQTWYDNTFTLPADANHANKVYVRWIPDFTSTLVGSSAPLNDGTSMSSIYVTATAAIFNDGIAPVLSSSVPAASATNASATGKIVLTFDEKVMLTSGSVAATLGSKTLTPAVSGKTITFAYTGLDYNTGYTFNLPANSVSDLAGNTLTSPISVAFTTMVRTQPTAKLFDFVVAKDGSGNGTTIQSAFDAVPAGNSTPYLIYVKNGTYSEYASLASNKGNVRLIGQSRDGVIITGARYSGLVANGVTYGTSTCQTLELLPNDTYVENITISNTSGLTAGQAVALKANGDRCAFKNIKLLAFQDTHLTGSGRQLYEASEIHGSVDYIFGAGDVFFNNTLLYCEARSGGGDVCTAPATIAANIWGYVFNNCTIDGDAATQNGHFYLGRPWQNAPRSVYINTKMNIVPDAAGWTNMGVIPALFAEYNSTTSAGTAIDLSNRKNSFTTAANPPVTTSGLQTVLTDAQAATYTMSNVLGGADNWTPTNWTESTGAPANVAVTSGGVISWNATAYAICYVILKNDVTIGFTTATSYNDAAYSSGASYKVVAVAESGALSSATTATGTTTGFNVPNASSTLVSQTYYTFDGRKIARLEGYKGTVIIRSVYADGHVETRKIMKLLY